MTNVSEQPIPEDGPSELGGGGRTALGTVIFTDQTGKITTVAVKVSGRLPGGQDVTDQPVPETTPGTYPIDPPLNHASVNINWEYNPEGTALFGITEDGAIWTAPAEGSASVDANVADQDNPAGTPPKIVSCTFNPNSA